MFSLKTGENDSFFYYTSNFLDESLKNELENFLETSKFHGGKCLSGKEIPRRQLWFQRQNGYFCNLWKYKYPRWESNEYSEVLDKIEKYTQTKINEILAKNNITPPNLNSILINKYRDDYEDMLLDLDEFLNLSMLQAVNLFNMSTKKNGVDKDSMELAKQIVDANNFRKALDDIMVYLDKQN